MEATPRLRRAQGGTAEAGLPGYTNVLCSARLTGDCAMLSLGSVLDGSPTGKCHTRSPQLAAAIDSKEVCLTWKCKQFTREKEMRWSDFQCTWERKPEHVLLGAMEAHKTGPLARVACTQGGHSGAGGHYPGFGAGRTEAAL